MASLHLLPSIEKYFFRFDLDRQNEKKKKKRKTKKGENVGGPNSGRVSTAFPSIDGPPSGNENFVYRVLANYSVDRRKGAFEDFIRGKAWIVTREIDARWHE